MVYANNTQNSLRGKHTMDSINTVSITHQWIREHVKPGDFCIDATAGKGNDTAFLCELVGATGRVLAFDILEDAVQSTRFFLIERGLDSIGFVRLDSHSHMDQYTQPETVDCIVFNFGYFPGGDRSMFTLAETSVEAIMKGLTLLKPDGIMCLSVYYGGLNGVTERDAILACLKALDPKAYTVIVCEFLNRQGNPAFPVYIKKGSY